MLIALCYRALKVNQCPWKIYLHLLRGSGPHWKKMDSYMCVFTTWNQRWNWRTNRTNRREGVRVWEDIYSMYNMYVYENVLMWHNTMNNGCFLKNRKCPYEIQFYKQWLETVKKFNIPKRKKNDFSPSCSVLVPKTPIFTWEDTLRVLAFQFHGWLRTTPH